ncbi:hypothetical protein GTY54_26305 [Streptomyces sp. SID625]|nr:hypothetical protein [Streptomyces sp. SID625]
MVSEPSHGDRTASLAAAVSGDEAPTSEGTEPSASRGDSQDVRFMGISGFKGGVKRGLIKHAYGAGKTEGLAYLAARSRGLRPYSKLLRLAGMIDLDEPRAVDLLRRGSALAQLAAVQRAIGANADITVVLGTFRNEHSDAAKAVREALAHLQDQDSVIANARPYLRRGRVRLVGASRRRPGSARTPLIKQIKASMSSDQAQVISERLNAADGPRRKLPPRP